MGKFYITVRNASEIIGSKEISEISMNAAKSTVTRTMKTDGYQTVGKWNNGTREFDNGTAVIEVIISDTATETETEKPPDTDTKTETETETQYKSTPLITEYERLIAKDDAQPSCVFTHSNHHVGEYVNLFFHEPKRARITRIIKTPKGIRFIVRFKNAFSVMKSQDLKRAESAARQARIIATRRKQRQAA